MHTERCPSCGSDCAPESKFCRHCGQPLVDVAAAATATAYVDALSGPAARRLISSGRIATSSFAPGTMLAGRYRIIGLLGSGGMGEVYRADDLKLGQPIALKFLPPALADDPVRRERLLGEVRIARQVSHPNVCRVYDIAEIEDAGPGSSRATDGGSRRTRYFLTMEYIDGEDLASLLQRIGYLSSEKALDITRQLVFGLAAAHERGVLHRDLKPANVMLDGRGRVRITDFGLAVAAGDDTPDDGAGTPLYMAPEQLAGQPATVRSDIYALGLILYELYTGRRAFTAPTLADLRGQKETSVPAAPSTHHAGVDPVVERVIMRCLERDPRQRPGSIAQVAAALPGGDPLAALIAAGETPSPEMVAAAGAKEGLAPILAVACLAALLIGGALSAVVNPRATLIGLVPAGKPPAVLIERAQEIIRKTGYANAEADSKWRFGEPSVVRPGDAFFGKWWLRLDRFNPLRFWYRQSPRSLAPSGFRQFPGASPAELDFNDPPLAAGDVRVVLDTNGRLRLFEAIPPQDTIPDATGTAPAAPDWSTILAEGPYDRSSFRPVEPRTIPSAYADQRLAWESVRDEGTVRFELASYRGRLINAQVIEPWGNVGDAATKSAETQNIVPIAILFGLVFVATIFFARRNWRLGRGDRRGAARLTGLVFAAGLAATAAIAHPDTFTNVGLIWRALQTDLTLGLFVGLMYLALEPIVRRYWPHLLVTWSRAFAGEFRDPLVARDLLIGCTTGVLGHTLHAVAVIAPTWIGHDATIPLMPRIDRMATPMTFLAAVLFNTYMAALFIPLIYLFVLFLSRLLVRREIPALLLATTVMTAASLSGFTDPMAAVFVMLMTLLMLIGLMKFGLLAMVVAGFSIQLSENFPLIADSSRWWAGYGYAAFGIILVLALYGFKTSLAGRPVFDLGD